MAKSLEERFWSKVDKNGPTMDHMDTNCWVWTAARDPKGYGHLWHHGRLEGSHRLSLSFVLGRMPEPFALHACDNPACVRPDHLSEGTRSRNGKEAYNRGLNPRPIGRENGRAKLTESDVREIRRRYGEGETQVSLGSHYGLDNAHISRIVRRKAWAHVN